MLIYVNKYGVLPQSPLAAFLAPPLTLPSAVEEGRGKPHPTPALSTPPSTLPHPRTAPAGQ